MQAYAEPRTLSDIAESAAFSMSDVAFISGLEESTIYRLWDNPNWLDKVSGRSLQALIATVPDLGSYVASHAMRSRRRQLIEDLAAEGLHVDQPGIERCIAAGIPEQYLSAALQAAVHIMRGDSLKASSYLARFWGAGQDKALTALFALDCGTNLLSNSDELIAASAELAASVERKAYSFHAVLTQAVFGHYISMAPGHSEASPLPEIVDRHSAFTYRASMTGLLISTNDLDIAENYRLLVQKTPVLRTVEDWSFPTYTRDTRPNSDFALPRSLLLRNTATEVISEIDSDEYGDAYLYYLISTYLPVALRRDPTFGLQAKALIRALLERKDRSDNTAIRATCESLAGLVRKIAA